ncbi:MAG: SMP-30/gluconolactonase/LRE family protein [Acidobacteria bacterium]|nr:SMP-30/gluconolactonase/LRE family protein [Acidobacteriota bacterium]
MKTAVLLAVASCAFAQVERLDPALDAIVDANAPIEKLAGGLGFIEGPVWIAKPGYLLFSDIPANAIMKWTPGDAKPTVFRQPSGFDGKAANMANMGSNGLALDKQGRLIICQHGNRQVVRVEKDGKVTVLADKFEGKRLNSPNDVVLRKDGAMYFTDPPYGLEGQDKSPQKEIPFNGVYLLKDGKVSVQWKELSRPNGIALSPDEKKLYVANSDGARKIWMVFDVARDGALSNGKVFADLTERKEPGGPDGMKVDRKGNLFVTGPGGIWIFSPAGKALGRIKPAEVPANCGFGGKDGKTLFMTARTGLYSVKVK